jgi:two-component system LytT family sensor kinase
MPFLLIVGFWLIATLLEATIVSAQEGVVFAYAVFTAGIKYGILALLAIPLVFASARLVLAPWWLRVGAHVAMGLVLVIAWQAAYLGFFYLQVGGLAVLRLERTAWWQALNAILTYAVLAAFVSVVQTSRQLRIEQARRAELALLAREAELRSLKAQLRPHFLFNTLNSIYSLIDSRPDEARAMVGLLGDLLRKTLETTASETVPLGAELDLMQTYLGIEQLRFTDRLHVRVDVPPDAAECFVPPLILQPLVENAVKHGIAPSVHGGLVEVSASRIPSWLELAVRNTGRGAAADPGGNGRGLEITRRRLRAMYGDRAELKTESGTSEGYIVRMRLPVMTTAEPSLEARDVRP